MISFVQDKLEIPGLFFVGFLFKISEEHLECYGKAKHCLSIVKGDLDPYEKEKFCRWVMGINTNHKINNQNILVLLHWTSLLLSHTCLASDCALSDEWIRKAINDENSYC